MAQPKRQCEKCHADVIFAKAAFSERPQIIDAAPNPEGKCFLITWGQGKGRVLTMGGPLVEVAQAAARRGEIELHMPHHATCPYAEHFRR